VVLVFVLLIVGLVPYVRKNTVRMWEEVRVEVPKFIWGAPKPETKIPVVVAAKPIPALKTLTVDDMKIENGPSEPAAKRRAATEGRYTLVPIAGGSPITDEAVSQRKFDFAPVLVLRVPLKSAPPINNQLFPVNVVAMFSARDGAHVGAQIPAILLALDSTSSAPTAIFALDGKNAAEVAKWIGSSDAYILFRP
jgi:hypothetical protein